MPRERHRKPAVCSACKAPLRWVLMTKSGKRNPVNPEPDERGNIALTFVDGVCHGRTLTKAELEDHRQHDGSLLFLSHFVTCPAARRFKR